MDSPLDFHTETGGEWVEFSNGYERDEYLAEHKLLPGQYLVERYQQSLVQYSLVNEGTQCRFDTAHGVAVITTPMDVTATRTADYCRAVLEQYSQWCNGELWEVHRDVFDSDGELRDHDAVYGFYSAEEAIEHGF